MESQVVPPQDIRFDPNAFFFNSDGTWTVLADTKICSDHSEFADTLLLPSGTRIAEGMFQTNNVDLTKVLNSASVNRKALQRDKPSRAVNQTAVVSHIPGPVHATAPDRTTERSVGALKVTLLLAGAVLEIVWIGGLGWMAFRLASI
jgi:hypothetical protein